MDLLRLTDAQQIISWLACEMRYVSQCKPDAAFKVVGRASPKKKHEKGSTSKKLLLSVLAEPSMAEACDKMYMFVHGVTRETALRGKLECQQREAINLLLEFYVISLHPEFREVAVKELSSFRFFTTAIAGTVNGGKS